MDVSWTVKAAEHRRIDAFELWCKTFESPLDCKEIQPVHSEDRPWDFFGRNDAKAEAPVLWPPHTKSWLTERDWYWEGLGAGEGDDRGWDGWMASLTRWTWVWVNSRGWWWTGRPAVDSWGHKKSDTAERLNWTECCVQSYLKFKICFPLLDQQFITIWM